MIQNLINIDSLSIVMISLITIISSIIIVFSRNYMKGDRNYRQFFINLSSMIISAIIMVSSDNIILFFISWCFSNLFLVKLMIHKKEWKMARNSGILALKNFSLGSLFLALAFVIFYSQTNSLQISTIISEINLFYEHKITEQLFLSQENYHSTKSMSNYMIIIALFLIFLAAMTQSALMPFHQWLLSSLNSPTPVSAIMHAGLVNGGGFLIVRFAPIFIQNTQLLNIIFIIGFISALIGTLFKLIQSDIKRMLASSTLSQMGFMIAQCGLGLFSAAIAHLCWHGFFKAYLFLSSAGCVQEKRVEITKKVNFNIIFFSIICGLLGAYSFAISSQKDISSLNTNYILIFLAFITSTQLALHMLKENLSKFLAPALIFSIIGALFYGSSIRLIDFILLSQNLSNPLDLNVIHIISALIMLILWIMMTFRANFRESKLTKNLMNKIYVKSLNASKPHYSTITSYRNFYKM